MTANIKKEKQPDIFFSLLLGEHTIICEGVLLENLNLYFIKPWDGISNWQKVLGKEEHVQRHHGNITNKIWTLRNTAGQMTRFLQLVASKGGKNVQMGLIDENKLKRHVNWLQCVDVIWILLWTINKTICKIIEEMLPPNR